MEAMLGSRRLGVPLGTCSPQQASPVAESQGMAEGPDAIAPDGSEIYALGEAPPDAGAAAAGPAVPHRASLVEVRLPAGTASRPVRHRTVEEIWYVLEGRGRVWRRPPDAPDVFTDVAPGSVLVIPTGWAFQFAASEGGQLRFLCFTSPPWPGADEAEPVQRGGLDP
jgi:mannose-6-phosphate isomerase-like protein (cupin superfamily)